MKKRHVCGCERVTGYVLDDPCPRCIGWAQGYTDGGNFDKTKKRWQLEPLDGRGEGDDFIMYAEAWRAYFLKVLDQTVKSRDPFRRRLLRLLHHQEYLEPRFWPGGADPGGFTASRLSEFLKNDKTLWLRAARPETELWERYNGVIMDSCDLHRFTREELIPLVASADPELRMLGLQRMAKAK